jgi:hypothetical protein
MYRNRNSMTVTATGNNITTGAASANAALPPASSGEIARYYRFACTAAAHIRLGTSGVTAVATDLMLVPGAELILDRPQGLTHWAAIQDTAAGTVNCTPLEDC